MNIFARYEDDQLFRLSGEQQRWIAKQLEAGKAPLDVALLAFASPSGCCAMAYRVLCACYAIKRRKPCPAES